MFIHIYPLIFNNTVIAIAIAFAVAVLLYIYIRFFWVKVVLNRQFRKIAAMTGEEFEGYVANMLANRGFKDICLTQKSNDFGIDIIARYRKIEYAIQVKRYTPPVGVAAVQEAYAGAKHYAADVAMVVTSSDFTSACYDLAESCDVVLVKVADFLDVKFAKKLNQTIYEQGII